VRAFFVPDVQFHEGRFRSATSLNTASLARTKVKRAARLRGPIRPMPRLPHRDSVDRGHCVRFGTGFGSGKRLRCASSAARHAAGISVP